MLEGREGGWGQGRGVEGKKGPVITFRFVFQYAKSSDNFGFNYNIRSLASII